MKFIHWTDERNVRSIKRYGLRVSNCSLGRGVYCMPIVSFTRRRGYVSRRHDGEVNNNKKAWDFLVSGKNRNSRKAAIVFELKTPLSFPVTAICNMKPDSPVWTKIETLMEQGWIDVTSEELEFTRGANQRGLYAELLINVIDLRALTQIAPYFVREIFDPRYWESFQVIIGRTIKPNEIVKIEMQGYKHKKKLGKAPAFLMD